MPVTHGLAVQLDESASRILQWFLDHNHFPSSDETIQEALHSLYREFHQGPGLPLTAESADFE